MNLLPFENLPGHTPRTFVPVECDLGDWSALEPLFDRLDTAIGEADSVEALQQWILDWGELSAALDEESSKRYIAMTCHTDNEDAERAYLDFVENIEPNGKPRQFKLSRSFLHHPNRADLPNDRFEVFDRDTAVHVELFREENVPLETEESRTCQQYQKLAGSLTVEFQGEEKTLVQMGRYLEENNRNLRQEAWELVSNRRLQEADKFEEQFEELLKLREQIAANAGFSNYRDFAFREKCRFDYGPEECLKFHAAIEQSVMPALRKLQAERREQLDLDALRPWDLAVDPLNRPPLRPFLKAEEMSEKTQRIFDRLDDQCSQDYQLMRELKLLDLANRKGKAPGGYQCTLAESRLPFIFMNAVGVQRDMETILHEAGHAFHALATREEDVYAYRHAPIEFCEVASMSMELLGNEFLEEFYETTAANRARRTHLEGILSIFPWIATVDAFQHWIYTHPGHTREERTAAWLELMDRFGGDVDWTGYEKNRANLWHRQLHIFLHPFYYVEYGIAQLGALQVWANSKENKAKALADYHASLKLGGSRPLPELFEAAGCTFDFSAATVEPLTELVSEELSKSV